MGKFFLFLVVVFLVLEALSSGTMSSEYRNRTNDELTTGTSQDDMHGITALTSAFEQLKEYSGDPCGYLTIWPWLLCTDSRVTSLFLSGLGLSGNLPDFSKMDALVTIDMSNNNLDGPIPEFLGKLPSLVYLDISNNHFSGKIPKSITSKTDIYYNIAGNPDVDLGQPKKKNNALIIGLALGIPITIAIKVLVIAFIVFSRRQRQQQQLQQQLQQQQQQEALSQGQAVAFVPGGTPHGQSSIDIGSVSMSTKPMGRPSNAMENVSGATNGENVPTPPMVYGSLNQSHPINPNVENTDDDEIAELLRQHGAHGGQ